MSLKERFINWYYGVPPARRREPRGQKVRLGGSRRREYRREEELGQIVGGEWTDRVPHPANMDKYKDLNKDPEVSAAIDVLSGMWTGVGYYTEMPEGEEKPEGASEDWVHPNKARVDEWAETVNFDEKLNEISRTMLGWGNCPIEKINDDKFKIWQPEYFYIYRNQRGNIYKYTLESSPGRVYSTWEGSKFKNIIRFTRNETVANPYGVALVDPLIVQIQARRDINADMPQVVKRFGYPLRVFRSSTRAVGDVVYDKVTEKAPDEAIFLDDVQKDDFDMWTETVDPRFNAQLFLDPMGAQICEALQAPLLTWIRNATEASANVMLEAVERSVQSAQRYIKRRVEEFFFKPLTGDPVPRLMWGKPKTALEEISLTDIANIANVFVPLKIITRDEMRDAVRELGFPLAEGPAPVEPSATEKPEPEFPFALADKGSLDRMLRVVQQGYEARKLTLTESLREADGVIRVYVDKQKLKAVERLSGTVGYEVELTPENETHFQLLRAQLFGEFRNKLIPLGAEVTRIVPEEVSEFTVSVKPKSRS